MRRVNEYRQMDNGSLKHINEWVLTGWGEKLLYILGWVWLVLFLIGFLTAIFN